MARLHAGYFLPRDGRNDDAGGREGNVTLRTEGMSYEIKYDTAAPIDTTTGKQPVMSERITKNLSRYEKSVADVEHQQKEWSLERESLTRENSSLQLSVDKLTRENRELKEKSAPSYPFNLKLLLQGNNQWIWLVCCFWYIYSLNLK